MNACSLILLSLTLLLGFGRSCCEELVHKCSNQAISTIVYDLMTLHKEQLDSHLLVH